MFEHLLICFTSTFCCTIESNDLLSIYWARGAIWPHFRRATVVRCTVSLIIVGNERGGLGGLNESIFSLIGHVVGELSNFECSDERAIFVCALRAHARCRSLF